MDVIIPTSFKSDKKPFAEMARNPSEMRRVYNIFMKTLRQSFGTDERRYGIEHRRRIQTEAEMKRRNEIMARWFRVFRGELGYSISQFEMEIATALRSELDGILYTPHAALRSYGVREGELQ